MSCTRIIFIAIHVLHMQICYNVLGAKKYLQWELVEWVNFIEVIQNEVQKWGPGCSWSITLSSFIDLLLCYLGLCYLYMYMHKIYFKTNEGDMVKTFCSISWAVDLVISKFSTRAVSPRKFPPAEERRERRESSSSFSLILNSFCCRVSSAYSTRVRYTHTCTRTYEYTFMYFLQTLVFSRSGLSVATTSASNWSSKPSRVTVKLIRVACACISGL